MRAKTSQEKRGEYRFLANTGNNVAFSCEDQGRNDRRRAVLVQLGGGGIAKEGEGELLEISPFPKAAGEGLLRI